MQYHYRQIRDLADAHLSSLPASILGWLLMFLVLMDATANALGQGAVSMWLLSLLPGSAATLVAPGIAVVLFQLLVFAQAARILMQSAWRMHLPYALRESNLWRYTLARHLKGQTVALSPEQYRTMLMVEALVLAGLAVVLWPLQRVFGELCLSLALPRAAGYGFFGLFLLLASWIASSLLRKFKNDSSVVFAVIIAASLIVASQLYGPDVAALFGQWHGGQWLREFYIWETGLLFTSLLLIAATALGDIHRNDSPLVNLFPNETPFTNLSESLQGFKAESFQVSLVPGANQRVLVFSRDWHSTDGIVNVHRSRINLPVVSREFWFWDLTLFKALLSQPLDFEKDTLDGMYRLRADIEAIPKTATLNNPPNYLSQVAVELAQDTLLDIGSLRRTIGEALLQHAESLLASRYSDQQTLDRPLNIGNVLVEIESLRTDLRQNLAKLKPTHRGAVESFSQVERRQYFDELTLLINGVMAKANLIMQAFDPVEINQALVQKINDRELIGTLANYTEERRALVAGSLGANDTGLFESSAQYIIDLLGISIVDVRIVLSPRMEELRWNAQTLVQSIGSEIQSWQTEIGEMEAAALDRIALYPTLGRFLNLRNRPGAPLHGNPAQAGADQRPELDSPNPGEPEIANHSSYTHWQD